MQEKSESAAKSENGTQKSLISRSAQGDLAEFLCLLGAYYFFRLPWVFMLPMSEAPDEFAHYWVIKFLKEHMCLPTAQDVQAGGASAVYGSLPQLGYIPHLIMSFGLPEEHLAIAERLGSLFGGMIMLFAAYKIGAILFSKNRLAALALPAAIVCHPQIVFIHSYANNDSTSSALASLIIWLAILTVKEGVRFKTILAMGALSGWLAVTKYSGLAVLPAAAFAVISSLIVNGSSPALAAGSILAATLLAAALSCWWFIQNNQQYPGDPLGTQTMYKSWAQTFNRELNYYLSPSHIIKDHRWWRMTFFSYWGLFGYMNKYLWRPVYFVYLGLVISAGLGFLRALWHSLKRTQPSRRTVIIWVSLLLTYVINIVSMIWASTKNLGGPQGRYLITSEIPIMALIIGGFTLWEGKTAKYLILAFLAFNAIVSVASFIYLFRLYGGWHLNPLI